MKVCRTFLVWKERVDALAVLRLRTRGRSVFCARAAAGNGTCVLSALAGLAFGHLPLAAFLSRSVSVFCFLPVAVDLAPKSELGKYG